MEERIKAAVILSLLSPIFGELVSGSSPPLEFVNPVGFALIWGLYGGGAIIMREIWVKYGRGYMRLMVLGIVYGTIEEGLAIKSFFDPNWMDLGIFSTYGRFVGVNFAWAFWLMAFHTIYSITVPILIVEAKYPRQTGSQFLTAREINVVLILFLISAAAMFFGLNPYAPPVIPYIITLAFTVYALKQVRGHNFRNFFTIPAFKRNGMKWSALFSSLIFVNYVFLPQAHIPALIVCSIGIVLLLSLYSSMDMKSPKETLGVAIGLLLPIVLFYDLILELNGVWGMGAVGLLTFIILMRWYRKMEASNVLSETVAQKI